MELFFKYDLNRLQAFSSVKEIDNQIYEINQEISSIYEDNILEQIQLKKKYDVMYQDADEISKQEEK